MIETLCESNISFVEEHFLSENIHSGIVANEVMKYHQDSLIVEQIEVMQEVLPQVSKLSGSLMSKTHVDQT